MGVVVIILMNLVLLLVLMSFLKFDKKYVDKFVGKENVNVCFWVVIVVCFCKKLVVIILIIIGILFVFGYF